MSPRLEQIDGPGLDRVIARLIILSDVVRHVIQAAAKEECPAGSGGTAAIGKAKTTMRSALASFEDVYGERELRKVDEFLAIATMFVADEVGWDGSLHPAGEAPRSRRLRELPPYPEDGPF